ncbi:hypothetical protein ACM7DR_28675 [Pseudomonas aeruginosa]
MTESKICTCPSGDGSLRHPCPAHPASVKQAGGDERAAFRPAQVISYRPGVGEVTIYVAGRVPGYMNIGDTVYVSDRAPVEQPSAALAQPSPAQAEQAEAERPAVVGYRSMESGMVYEQDYGLKDPEALTTVAECDSIVGELRAEIAQLRQHKNDYMDAGQETYRALQNEIREREAEIARLDGLVSGRTAERDAALARVAELERKLRDEENAHTTTIEQRDNAEHWADQLAKAIAERFGVDIGEHSNLNCPWNEALVWMQQPPAQAQHSVPEGVTIERDVAGTIHIKVGDFDFIQLQYQRPYTDNASTWKLAERIASLLAAAPGKEGV